MTVGCYDCDREAELDDLEACEAIHVGPGWRVAHAFNSALPGWLILAPRRHVESLADLTPDEAAELGPLIRAASRALVAVCGASKTYLMQFAENPGFAHVHCHLVPRAADLPAEHRGPDVFWYLTRPVEEQLDLAQRNAVSREIAAVLAGNSSPTRPR